MINFTKLRNDLYTWAAANVPSGMPVIYRYANAPRPTVDYVSLYMSSFVEIGWDYTQDPLTTGGMADMVGDREFTLQCQAYGTNSMQVLENLRTSLQSQVVLDSLRSNGIVYFNWGQINDLTDLIDSRYESRAVVDLFFRIAQNYTDSLGVISTVQAEETLYDAAGSVIVSQTIDIPPA